MAVLGKAARDAGNIRTGTHRFAINQYPQLITQIQQLLRHHANGIPKRIKTHRLEVDHIPSQQLFVNHRILAGEASHYRRAP